MALVEKVKKKLTKDLFKAFGEMDDDLEDTLCHTK